MVAWSVPVGLIIYMLKPPKNEQPRRNINFLCSNSASFALGFALYSKTDCTFYSKKLKQRGINTDMGLQLSCDHKTCQIKEKN